MKFGANRAGGSPRDLQCWRARGALQIARWLQAKVDRLVVWNNGGSGVVVDLTPDLARCMMGGVLDPYTS